MKAAAEFFFYLIFQDYFLESSLDEAWPKRKAPLFSVKIKGLPSFSFIVEIIECIAEIDSSCKMKNSEWNLCFHDFFSYHAIILERLCKIFAELYIFSQLFRILNHKSSIFLYIYRHMTKNKGQKPAINNTLHISEL